MDLSATAPGLPSYIIGIFVLVYGLSLGSFTTCVIYRLPRGISLWRRKRSDAAYRSFCPQCRHPLSARDLIPVLSWAVQRGRCRHCRQAIGWFYPVVELGVLLVVAALVVIFGFGLKAFALSLLLPVLAGLTAFFSVPQQGRADS